MCMMQGGRSLCLMSAILNGRYEDSPLCVCRYVMETTKLSLTIVEYVFTEIGTVKGVCFLCHTHTHTHPHSRAHTLTHHHEALQVKVGNRNPRDLKRTDEQRQVETASSPSQIIRRWQQSTHIILTHGRLVAFDFNICSMVVLAKQWVLMMCQSVAVSVSTINNHTVSVGNPVGVRL